MRESSNTQRSSKAITIDEDRWPIVVVCFGGGPVPLAEWEALFATVAKFVAKETPFALLMDARNGLGASAAHRRAAGEFIRNHEAGLRRYCRGVVTVSDSALVRGVITAIQWIVPPPFPERVESDIDASLRWLEQQLQT